MSTATNWIGNAAVAFGALSLVVVPVVKGIQALTNWLNEVDQASKKLIEDNRELAKYSGTTAVAYANLDRGRIIRQAELSQDMGGALSRLTGAQDRYESAKQDLTMPFEKLSVDLQAFKTEMATNIIKAIDYLEPISEVIEWFYRKYIEKEDKNEARNAVEFLARETEKNFGQRKW